MTNLYNGYTESESMTAQRAFSRQMEALGYKIQRPTSTLLNTEAEVDRVRDLIDCAELNDLHPVDAAQSIEQAIDATLHAEDLGTHTIVSGGEVLELGSQAGSCEDIF